MVDNGGRNTIVSVFHIASPGRSLLDLEYYRKSALPAALQPELGCKPDNLDLLRDNTPWITTLSRSTQRSQVFRLIRHTLDPVNMPLLP